MGRKSSQNVRALAETPTACDRLVKREKLTMGFRYKQKGMLKTDDGKMNRMELYLIN